MENANNALQSLLCRPKTDQESSGYLHTASEIASQPMVWRKTLQTINKAFSALSSFIGQTDRLLITGAGSSYYAATSVAPLLTRSFRTVEAIPSTEILMDPESSLPREEFVLVSLARSGNSPEGNAVFELASSMRPGLVKQLVITCNRDGELARLAQRQGANGFMLLLPEESNDQSLAMTASFSSLAIAGYALGFTGARDAYAAAVEGLAAAAEALLAGGSTLAHTLAGEGFSRVFFLGSRPFLGGVLEAHLKVQEMSGGKIVAKAEDTLGFRHGFMAAVDPNSLIILALSRDPCRHLYEMDLLREIGQKGIGRKTVVIGGGLGPLTDLVKTDLADAFFDYGSVPAMTDEMLAPLVAMTGQMLGLFLSLREGLRPDNPSPSGIINRVVQGVHIHPRTADRPTTSPRR
jgi:tagatose-6-phosphate ketose/aldose isomerase